MTIIQKFETDQTKGLRKLNKKYAFLVGAILLILMLAEIWVSNSVALEGEKLEKISQTQKALLLQNQILENEIAKSKSMSAISSKSAELGFSAPESIEYIR